MHGPVVHPAAVAPSDLFEDCRETRTRRSGPGGQHRNKVETAVVLVHLPTGLAAEASERRSQAENRAVALFRLRLRLALEHRGRAGGAAASALWRSRTHGRRLVIAAGHDDYPALVAEALDHLQEAGWQPAAVAGRLGVSATQLVGLFRKSPVAWAALARHRVAAGLPALK